MALGFCPQCGASRTGDRFCAKCGADFEPQPVQGQSQPSMTRMVIRSQAQNTLPRLGAFVAFFVGMGLFAWLTYGAFAGSNPLLWLGGTFVAGLVAGWAVGTWIQVMLA